MNWLSAVMPFVYTASRQLIGGNDFNNLAAQLNSMESGIVAAVGGGQTNARQLKAAMNTVATVATAADSVKLPKGYPGLTVWITNEDADALFAFGYGQDTIDGIAYATGKTQAQGTTMYRVNKYDPVTKIANWVTK